jgi:hypothetical protein
LLFFVKFNGLSLEIFMDEHVLFRHYWDRWKTPNLLSTKLRSFDSYFIHTLQPITSTLPDRW